MKITMKSHNYITYIIIFLAKKSVHKEICIKKSIYIIFLQIKIRIIYIENKKMIVFLLLLLFAVKKECWTIK